MGACTWLLTGLFAGFALRAEYIHVSLPTMVNTGWGA